MNVVGHKFMLMHLEHYNPASQYPKEHHRVQRILGVLSWLYIHNPLGPRVLIASAWDIRRSFGYNPQYTTVTQSIMPQKPLRCGITSQWILNSCTSLAVTAVGKTFPGGRRRPPSWTTGAWLPTCGASTRTTSSSTRSRRGRARRLTLWMKLCVTPKSMVEECLREPLETVRCLRSDFYLSYKLSGFNTARVWVYIYAVSPDKSMGKSQSC